MLDTVGFYVPITEKAKKKVKELGVRTLRMNQLTGEITLDNSNMEMQPSFGRKVQFKLRDHRYDKDFHGRTALQKCGPYFKVEFSVCKYLLGRNIESVPLDSVIDAVWSIISEFKRLFDIDLPSIDRWFIYRLDLCANFVLDGLQSVTSFIRFCRNLDYGRKKKSLYSEFKDVKKLDSHDTCLYFGSAYETFKIYAKGPEFRVHDRCFEANENIRRTLQVSADKILRVELEMKKSLLDLRRKIEGEDKRKYHYNEAHRFRILLYKPNLSDDKKKEYSEKIVIHTSRAKAVKIQHFNLFNGYMNVMDTLKHVNYGEIMRNKLVKLLNGTESKIMKSAEVEKKLSLVLGDESGKFYFAMYMMLITQGQVYVKSRFARATYYKGLRLFRDNSISFLSSDVKMVELGAGRGFPADFSLSVSSENRYYQVPLRLVA